MSTSDEIIKFIEDHATDFPGATAAEKKRNLDEALPKIRAALDVPMDDRRAAAQLAIEAPKLFITMALAAIVAIATLVQLGWNSFIKDNNIVLWICFAAGAACFISMYFGVLAINSVYKTGQASNNRWSLEGIKIFKNLQALLGILAIVLFVVAVGIAVKTPISGGGILVRLPGSLQASLPNGIIAKGNWSTLQLDGGNGVHVELDPVPTGETRSFEIRSR